jgi:membrane associated rhomboid family serine protease
VLIPLGTDRPIRRPSVVTPTLIVLCVAAFVAQRWADSHGDTGAFEARFWVIGGEGFAWYRAVSYAFLHGDFLHLAGNMLFLWVFGRPVEDRLGRAGFSGLYLAGAVAAGLGHAWLENAPAIGASGAVSAVTGAFLVLFPRTRIRVLWFMIIITLLMAPAWFFIGLQIAWNILAGVTGSAGNVAVIAHLAGYAFGFAVAFTLLASGLIAKEPCDLFSISKHAKRRQEFRAAARLADRSPRPGTAPAARPASRAPAAALDERSEALAKDRAAVSAALSEHKMDKAVSAYRTLIERHANRGDGDRGAVTLSRNAQYRLATHLASEGSASLAIRAFDDLLGAYPGDPEAGAIRVLLARLCAGMGATSRARRLLSEAIETARDEDVRSLARDELAALGPGPAADGGGA